MKLLPLVLCLLGVIFVEAKLQERFHWKQLAFDWPNAEAEQAAIKSGQYVVENNLPLGLEKWKNKLFVTVPRWKSGVAASLNYVDIDSKEESPKLRPYPSWQANQVPTEKCGENACPLKDNSTIISIFRLQADSCDRLWVLDTGLADILGEGHQAAPSAIVVYDLKTDKLIRRFVIPEKQLKEDSFCANIIVDSEPDDCNNAHAYIPDLGAYGVIVYSFHDNHSFRVKHNFFHFDPLQGDFNVGGVNFQWTDGVFGMAVGPKKLDGSKDIYFHALASTKEFMVSNLVLQNESYVTSPEAYYDFKLLGDRGMNGQSTSEAYDKQTDVVFYTQVNKDAIACWNAKKSYTADNQGLIDSDSHTLVFPNDLKIDNEGTLWVLSDKMPSYLYKELDPAAVNYRVLMGNNRELIKGTPCEG